MNTSRQSGYPLKVRFTDTGDNMLRPNLTCQHSGERKEQQIPSWYERRRQLPFFPVRHCNVTSRQRIRCQLVQQRHVQNMMRDAQFLGNVLRAFDFQAMTLIIIKRHRFHFRKCSPMAQNRHVVLSCPPLNTTTAFSFFIISIKLLFTEKNSTLRIECCFSLVFLRG